MSFKIFITFVLIYHFIQFIYILSLPFLVLLYTYQFNKFYRFTSGNYFDRYNQTKNSEWAKWKNVFKELLVKHSEILLFLAAEHIRMINWNEHNQKIFQIKIICKSLYGSLIESILLQKFRAIWHLIFSF